MLLCVTASPYITSIGQADGSIIAAIMTAHIVHSSSRCVPSQTLVIIQADGPVIAPYMSRAIATIHHQERSSTITTAAVKTARSRHGTTLGGRRVLRRIRNDIQRGRSGDTTLGEFFDHLD